MALTNCTINSVSVTATSGVANIADQILYIVPDEGFTVSAVDFDVSNVTSAALNTTLVWTHNPSATPSITIAEGDIDSITLSNTTTAHTVGNKVKVLVNLADDYSITYNAQLTIDIDGAAQDENIINVKPVLVQGDFWYLGGGYGDDYTDCDITVIADTVNGFTVADTTHTTTNNNGSSHKHWTFTGNVLSGVSTKIGTVSVERATEHDVDRSVVSANIYSQGSSWSVGHSKFEALNNTLTNLDGWGDKVTFDLYFSDTSSTTVDTDIEEVATSLISTFRVISTSLEDLNPSIDDITFEDSGTGDNSYLDSDSSDVEITVTTSTGSSTGDTEATVTIEMFEGLDTLTAMTDTLIALGTVFEPNSSITYTTTTNSTNGSGAEVTVWVDSNGNVYQVSISATGDGYMVGDELLIGPAVAGSVVDTNYTSPDGEGVDSLPDVFSGVNPNVGNTGDTLTPTTKYPPTDDIQTNSTITTKFPCPALPDKVAKGFLLVVGSDATSIVSSSAKKATGSKLSNSALANKAFIPIYQYANPTITLKAVAEDAIAGSATVDFGFVSYANVTTAGAGSTSSATATPFNGLPNAGIESVSWMNNNLTEQDFIFKLEESGTFSIKYVATDANFTPTPTDGNGNVVEITNLATSFDNSGSIKYGIVSGTIRYDSFGTGDAEYKINFDDIFTIAR
tara:strand:- start:1153 stop:3192 length:2040 start_codon:yes stop_codon:yes gene_type:complete